MGITGEPDVAITTAAHDDDHPMFSHPDDTSWVDSRVDPIADVADLQREFGPILHGIGVNNGSSLQVGDAIIPQITVTPARMANGAYAAITWEAGKAIYGNQSIYSASIFAETTGQFWGHGIFEMDGAEHAKYRQNMQAGFMPRLVRSWETDIIRPVLKRYFEKLKPRGKADLVRDLNAYFPYDVIGEVVGFNAGDIEFVAEQLKRMHRMQFDLAGAIDAGIKIKAYAKALIDERRKSPRSDMVSAMCSTEIGGEPIRDDIFVAMVVHLMQGGIDTVYRLCSNLMSMLLDNPDQLDMVRQRRELIPRAIEEALRHQGVPAMLPRVSLADHEVLGVHIPKDQVVFVVHAAINRDPTRWENPNKFDILREPKAHMAFGFGPHSCIGLHLARFEIAHYLEHIFEYMPNIRWDPAVAENPPRITGWGIRGTNSLPVVWDA